MFLNAENVDRSDCAHAQVVLGLCWVHKSEGTFSHVAAFYNNRIAEAFCGKLLTVTDY